MLNLVKQYLNKSEKKTYILDNIKNSVNNTLSQLKNRFSDGFFIYFGIDYNLINDGKDYIYYLNKTDNVALLDHL